MRFVRLPRPARPLPLTAKLTLWNTLVVLLVAIVALVSVREGLRLMLIKELESALEAEAYETALSASRSPPASDKLFQDLEDTSAGHIRKGWFLQLFKANDATLLWSSENTPEQFVQPPFNLPETSQRTREHNYRLAVSREVKSGDNAYQVRVGTPLDFVQEDIDNVTRIWRPFW